MIRYRFYQRFIDFCSQLYYTFSMRRKRKMKKILHNLQKTANLFAILHTI